MARVGSTIAFFPNLFKKTYDLVLGWAAHKNAPFFLFFLAFAEASFFPIPPDIMLIAMGLAVPKRSFKWAGICLAGSVLGGLLGYTLGYFFMATVGDRILEFYHLMDKYEQVRQLYQQYEAWAVAAGGFTPLPYKLFTITAGAFRIDLPVFVVASAISRGMRFYLVAGTIYFFGPKVRYFLENYFNLFTIVFTLLLIGGYLILKWLF